MHTGWKQGLVALLVGVTVVSTCPAWAGLKSFGSVVVKPTTGEAHGTLGNTRLSADTQQLLGCEVYTSRDPLTGAMMQSVSCLAQDAAGATLECTSEDPGFVTVARALRGYGWVYFRIDPTELPGTPEVGTCQALTVKTGSPYLPEYLR